MLLLNSTIVNVALPDMESQLRAALSDLQWVIDAYALSLAALRLRPAGYEDLRGPSLRDPARARPRAPAPLQVVRCGLGSGSSR
jgi:hypothetical protein